VTTGTGELRATADVTAWLGASLLLRRVPGLDGEDDGALATALVACAHELAALPPAGMIADVAALLAGARLPLPPAVPGDAELRAAVRGYDDDVLARLVLAARYDDVLAAYAHLPANDRATAIALVVAGICARAEFVGAAVSPAALRRALARPREERDQLGRTALVGGAIATRLADAYQRLAGGARRTHALVGDSDVFTIDHIAALRDLGGRMTLAHVSAAAEALSRALPRRLPALRMQRGTRDTQFADDTLYPAGGFTAITPGGSNANIENLVTSELVYMEDGPGPDVFTLRYVEGELLYYTRDDSVFRRHRHVIAIVLDEDLERARVKDRDLSWQRLVIALALVVTSVRWLADQLGDRALTIDVCFPARALVEERAIMALLLEAEIERGSVRVLEQPLDATIAALEQASGSAVTDAVLVSQGAPEATPKAIRAMHVDVSAAVRWDEWTELTEQLLRWLV
jgi:hypothetical protein